MVNSLQLSQLNGGRPNPPTPKSVTQTPSSTTVEYGDHRDFSLSATEQTPDRVFRVLSSKDSTPHPGFEDSTPHPGFEDDMDDPTTPVMETPIVRKPRPIVNKMLNDKIGRFLNTITESAGDVNNNLVQENRGLQQRVVALERNEHHLMTSLKENQAAQRQQLEDEFQAKQEALDARIKDLERQVAEKEGRISQLTAQVVKSTATVTASITDADIASWYETRSNSWSAWVDEFAHDSPNRMVELHPLQQQEVNEGVQNFIRLADDGRLPPPLAAGFRGSASSLNTTRLLLLGMLTDFIVTETLESPFWIFSALSKQGFDVESPMMQGSRGSEAHMSPMAFRLDLASFENNGAPAPLPSPFIVPPAPTTARSISMLSPRHAPPVFTPLSSLSINTKGLSLQYNLPTKPDMEDLETLLTRSKCAYSPASHASANLLPAAQQKDGDACAWRAQLMRTLSEGGLSRDPCHPSMVDENKQMLANARREYARQLKERFLGSAARFFLRDQDAQGISKLEGQLVSELDLALRFSAQAWSRLDPIQFLRLKQLGAGMAPHRRFRAGDDLVEACAAQREEFGMDEKQVVMVLRPAVGSLKKIGGPGKVWVKAQVVGAPIPATKPLKVFVDNRFPVLGGGSSTLDSLPSIQAVQAFMAAKNVRSPRSTATTPVTAELRINISPVRPVASATRED